MIGLKQPPKGLIHLIVIQSTFLSYLSATPVSPVSRNPLTTVASRGCLFSVATTTGPFRAQRISIRLEGMPIERVAITEKRKFTFATSRHIDLITVAIVQTLG
ncbi:hypothetical protein PanWU01x14_057780 [Parasponia andersonii]|uniref:Uncharacterized protein n=1 Tax=Parasponia andersonii TaxID=3476 RepID=A0A2P5DJZ0_PARAD|nr:hypothetical protein PanWU01x14_057780 [Parasponia andersonii]